MPNLDKPLTRINARAGNLGGGAAVVEAGGAAAAPAVTPPPAPQGLRVLNSVLQLSSSTPKVTATLDWRAPAFSVPIVGYLVQWSRSLAFTGTPEGLEVPPDRVSTAFPGLPPGETIHFRVAAVALGGVLGAWSTSVTATMAADVTPPDAVVSASATFLADGALRVGWVNPESANLKHVEVEIWDSASKLYQYDQVEVRGSELVWTAARNRSQSALGPGPTPDPALYVELWSRSHGGVRAASAVTLSPTKARPATPVVSVDFSGPAARFGCAPVAGAVRYRWTIDGETYETSVPELEYTLAMNIADHGAADPTLSYSVVAIDGLDQTSAAAAAGTATNGAPAASTIAATGGFATMALQITPPASLPTDLRDYRVRVYRNSVLVATFFTTELLILYRAANGDGTYTADVTTYDLFNQPSTASAQSAGAVLTDDAQFAADLRSGAIYSDSLGTAATTLKAALADGNRSSGGQAYASGSGWKWTQVRRELADRYQPLLITATAGQGYVSTSSDGSTWTYYSGPLTGTGGDTLTQVASEAAAQSAALSLPTTTSGLWQLPALVEARYVRLHHRNVGAGYTLREWYPERVVEGDLVRAGSIRTRALAAGAVTADIIAAGAVTAAKISVTELSAIAADLGTVTAGLITGATYRTAASGQRVEITSANGLRGIDSGGTVQVQIRASDGALAFAGGGGTLGVAGLRFNDPGISAAQRIEWAGWGTASIGPQVGLDPATRMALIGPDLELATVSGNIDSFTGLYSGVGMLVSGGRTHIGGSAVRVAGALEVGAAGDRRDATITGGLNVGSSSGAVQGQIVGTSTDALASRPALLNLRRNVASGGGDLTGVEMVMQASSSTGTIRDLAAISYRWAAAADASRRSEVVFLTFDATSFRVPLTLGTTGSAAAIGFLGAGPVARQTVTGSRGGNAALASLLTAFANLGLVVNSTTA